MRILLKSAAVSFSLTAVVALVFLFFVGGYSYVPTAAAASLKVIPEAQQAAWIAANTKVVSGSSYAAFVVTDSAMRSVALSGFAYLFAFGLICALASAFMQRRSADV